MSKMKENFRPQCGMNKLTSKSQKQHFSSRQKNKSFKRRREINKTLQNEINNMTRENKIKKSYASNVQSGVNMKDKISVSSGNFIEANDTEKNSFRVNKVKTINAEESSKEYHTQDDSSLLDMTAINGLQKGKRLVEECKKICNFIKLQSDSIVNVWPAKDCLDNNKIVFVCDVSEVTTLALDTNYNCVTRILNQYSQEDIDVLQHSSYKSQKLNFEQSERLRRIINKNAATLMNRHTFLSVITGSAVRSKNYAKGKHKVEAEACIVLYVDSLKGKIPLNENSFPKEIDGIRVDVREGGFSTAGHTAKDVLGSIRMGCQISAVLDQYGTLGGFIDHKEYGLCGFTCAHVLLDENNLSNLTKTREIEWNENWNLVYQPTRKNDDKDRDIGRLLSAYYKQGQGNSGVDLALFSIDKRAPGSGEFPETEEMVYDGKVCGEPHLRLNNGRVKKFGCASNITHGQVVFSGTAVKRVGYLEGRFKLFGQYSVKPNDQTNVFIRKGDSGSLVFTEDSTGELLCIGMAVGFLSSGIGIVTPISAILKQLNVSELKSFKSLKTDREIHQLATLMKEMMKHTKNLESDVKKILERLENHDQKLESINKQLITRKDGVLQMS